MCPVAPSCCQVPFLDSRQGGARPTQFPPERPYEAAELISYKRRLYTSLMSLHMLNIEPRLLQYVDLNILGLWCNISIKLPEVSKKPFLCGSFV